MTSPAAAGVPPLGENEYWFAQAEVAEWLADGVFYLVSPLDSANMTEVELSEEQEVMLNWLDQEPDPARSRGRMRRAIRRPAQARMPVTTSPWTSVSRMSRPPKR